MKADQRKIDYYRKQIECWHKVFSKKTPSANNLKELERSKKC